MSAPAPVWVEVVPFVDGEADGGFWGALVARDGSELHQTSEYDSSQEVMAAARRWAAEHGYSIQGRLTSGD